jgi:nicotinamide-nucleotide amidase
LGSSRAFSWRKKSQGALSAQPPVRIFTLPRRLSQSINQKTAIVKPFRKYYNIFMQLIAAETHKLLIKDKKTLAVAESCTGGLLSSLLTSRSGSSGFFILGVVVYSNLSKTLILKVPASYINKHGAVSRPVAIALATNVRAIAKTDYGIGITGIAGPTGAIPGKPVGTVFIAVSSKAKTVCRRFRFKGARSAIRRQSAFAALKLLRQIIK